MVVASAYRLGRGFHFECGVEALIDPRDYRNAPDGAFRLTADVAAALERAVRRSPEQYFWLHNRWKHKPPAPKQRAAA